MEPGQEVEFPLATYQLAEQHRVGQPLALYTMHPRWVRIYQVVRNVLLGVVIFVVLFFLMIMALFLYQLYTERIADLQLRLKAGLPGNIVGLMGCVAWLYMRHSIAQSFPVSILVCTEGLLELRPKGVDVTRWDEVKWSLQSSGGAKNKRYTLYRINRKPFSFGKIFEDVEGLADLVRPYTQKAER